jgi:hypothetical protein
MELSSMAVDFGTWFFVGLFFALIITLALIHARINHEFKIEPTWVALAATPALLWLALSGRITEMTLPGGMGFKTAALQSVSLKSDGEKISPDTIEIGMKGGMQNLDDLKQRGTLALSFELGGSHYDNLAIQQYLTALTELRYIIFTNREGVYVGFAPASLIRKHFGNAAFDLAQFIENSDTERIPGFTDMSVRKDSSRAAAPDAMDQAQLAEVPVVDANGRFVGMLDRDKLTSSIVADLVAGSFAGN